MMLAVGPAFCAAVGITMVHAWIDGRRPMRRQQRARAALRHERVLARGQAQL
ncbi:hypothetical protein [Sorangium sp. So ce854]|uniref:hypothetical protein n=1 Tax=Sorangium sp. So ce854 TaxID=3133322 RepID=UPI003F62ABCC